MFNLTVSSLSIPICKTKKIDLVRDDHIMTLDSNQNLIIRNGFATYCQPVLPGGLSGLCAPQTLASSVQIHLGFCTEKKSFLIMF